jgi:hypothetical protein
MHVIHGFLCWNFLLFTLRFSYYDFNLIACIAICWHAIPDLTFTALQYLVVEYCERNQWGRSWGETTSQEPWFWKDISWASSFEDNCFCKYFHLSCWKLLALYFGCCCFQQCLLLMKTPNPFLGRIFIFSNKYFWFLCWEFCWLTFKDRDSLSILVFFFGQFISISSHLVFSPSGSTLA